MAKTVLAIITDKNRILIGKVKKERVADMGGIEHVFPGGKVENGEELDNAVIREVKEETGLTVSIKKLIHTCVHPITHKEISYFHCLVTDRVLVVSSVDNDDIDLLIWVNRNELKTYMPSLNEAVDV